MSTNVPGSEVKVPYLQRTPTGWRYRRRIMPKALASHLGKAEWKSPIFAQRWQAVREAERLKPIHDEIIGRWKNGEAVDDVPEFVAAVEAKAQHLRALRPEEYEAAVDTMEADGFRRMFFGPGFETVHRELIAERGGFINPVSGPPYGPLDVDIREIAERVSRKAGGDLAPIDLAAIKAAKEGGGRHRPQTMPLSKAYERDKAEYGGSRAEKFIGFAVRDFKTMVGDRDFFSLKRADVEAWIKAGKAKNWAPGTIKRRSVALQGIHTRLLIAFDIPASSVWRKLDYGFDPASEDSDNRLPFNSHHLKALDSYLDAGGVNANVKRILEIMRFTGLGAKEVAGLRVRDFVLDDPTPHVWIRPHEGRRLKTKTRKRAIPLLGRALVAAREAVASASGEFVFVREMKTNTAQMLSKNCNVVIRAAGVPRSPRLSAYSFRHGLGEAMKVAKLSEDVRKYVLGHARSSVTEGYGSSAPMRAELAKDLAKAHACLGQVDDSIFEPYELMPAEPANIGKQR
jgi:integrase